MNVLILGHNGMLGHMVLKFLKSKDIKCSVMIYRWPEVSFQESIMNFDGDFIINCIGSIPQRNNDFSINYKLPIFLDAMSYDGCKIIHPGSDCENDKSPYGESKKIASDWIRLNSTKTKTIKTSIIGPEISSNYGLMEWFLSQEKEANGYSEFYWNGNTTLTWAKYCYEMIKNWNYYAIETILHSECISKYTLLKIINRIYDKKIDISKTNRPAENRCVYGGIRTPDINDQLKELIKWSN